MNPAYLLGTAAADRAFGTAIWQALLAIAFAVFIYNLVMDERARNKKRRERLAKIENRQLLQRIEKAEREAGPFYEVTGR